MRKVFFIPVILLTSLIVASCKDDAKGKSPNDYLNNRERDDSRNKDKDDNKDDLPDDYGMDRDHPDRQSLIGTWSVRDFESADGEELSDSEKSEMRSSTIEFIGDGTYMAKTRSNGQSETEYGTYTYNERTKTLTTVADKSGEKEILKVEFDGKDWVTVTSDEGKIRMERY
jgi:hypothetical protein